jgi:twinkle protein
MTPETPREIAELLARDTEKVCQELWPEGKREGHEWRVGDVYGSAGHSLACVLTGNKAGVWCDFADPNHKGDLLDAWALRYGLDLGEALREAKTYLGIAPLPELKPRTSFAVIQRPQHSRVIIRATPSETPIPESPGLAYLHGRGFTDDTLRAFHILEQPNSWSKLPDNPGDIVFPYLIRDAQAKSGLRLVNNKYLAIQRGPNGEKATRFEKDGTLVLFGWHLIKPDARKVVLCEGEGDCLTWHQVGAPALSVPNGATSHKWLELELDNLMRFDEIFISFDMDEPGEKGALELIERLGRHRCRRVKLPQKDANACLQAGMDQSGFLACLRQAEFLRPEEFITFPEGIERVKERRRQAAARNGAPEGMILPWAKASTQFFMTPGQLTVWTGYGGHGKTTLLSHILAAMLSKPDGESACIASLEMTAEETVERLCCQLAGRSALTDAELDALGALVQDRCVIYHHVGSSSIDKVLEIFTYARRRHGVTQFVVDSLMMLGIGHEDYDRQLESSQRLIAFAREHRSHVHLVIHPKKPTDEGKAPGMYDVKGSGGLVDGAHNVVVAWRNKRKFQAMQDALLNGMPLDQRLLDEPDTTISIQKNRLNGWTATIPLWFNADSQQFLERPNDYPVIYLQPTVAVATPF